MSFVRIASESVSRFRPLRQVEFCAYHELKIYVKLSNLAANHTLSFHVPGLGYMS